MDDLEGTGCGAGNGEAPGGVVDRVTGAVAGGEDNDGAAVHPLAKSSRTAQAMPVNLAKRIRNSVKAGLGARLVRGALRRTSHTNSCY